MEKQLHLQQNSSSDQSIIEGLRISLANKSLNPFDGWLVHPLQIIHCSLVAIDNAVRPKVSKYIKQVGHTVKNGLLLG